MEPSKDEIKNWLSRHNRDRQWLADKLGKKLGTVNNWLSTSISIPDGTLALIRRLIQDDTAAEAQRQRQLDPVNQVFSLEVDLPRFRRYSAAALAKQQTLENWAIQSLDELAGNIASTIGLRVPLPISVDQRPLALPPPQKPLYAADISTAIVHSLLNDAPLAAPHYTPATPAQKTPSKKPAQTSKPP